MNVNSVTIAGRLSRDPTLRYLPSQSAVVDFGLAINRRWKTDGGEDREEVTFVDVTAFGKVAELINSHFTKGKEIFLQGRLKYDSWEDKNGGGKRHKLSVVADHFQFVGYAKEGEGPARSPGKSPPRDNAPPNDGPPFDDSDIPFAPAPA